MKRRLSLIGLAIILCAGVSGAFAQTTYYVNPTGAGGEYSDIQEAIKAAVNPGDTVVIRDGFYDISSRQYIESRYGGTADHRITIKAENPGGATITSSYGRVMRVSHPYVTVEGLIFDGQYTKRDVLQIRNYDGVRGAGASNLVLRGVEVRNGGNDGVDIGDYVDDMLIEDSLIHNMLYWNGGRDDAHGVVASGVLNLTIRNTEIHHVSGDSFQIAYGNWDNVLVENCNFWNGPLPSAQAGFPAGVNPGENAIDTKSYPDELRGTLTLRDSEFHGWNSDYLSSGAALRLKQHCDVIVEGCEIYDSRIGIRAGGYHNRAPGDVGVHVTAKNNVFYENGTAIRYEAGIVDLKVINNTFDDNTSSTHSPDGPDMSEGFYNNLFLGASVSPESDDSCMAVGPECFVDADNHDYHLVAGCAAVDAGDDMSAYGVLFDFDSVPRPQGSAYDVGAYELPEPTSLVLLAAGALTLAGRGRKQKRSHRTQP